MGAGNGQRFNDGYRNGGRPTFVRGDQRIKFDSDFDFEKANEKFQEQLSDVEKGIEGVTFESEEGFKGGEVNSAESGTQSPASNAETFYNKTTSFFDNISCEAIEKEEGLVFKF